MRASKTFDVGSHISRRAQCGVVDGKSFGKAPAQNEIDRRIVQKCTVNSRWLALKDLERFLVDRLDRESGIAPRNFHARCRNRLDTGLTGTPHPGLRGGKQIAEHDNTFDRTGVASLFEQHGSGPSQIGGASRQ